MGETQAVTVRALRPTARRPERTYWDELIAANRALLKTEGAIGTAMKQTGAYAGTG